MDRVVFSVKQTAYLINFSVL